MRKRAPAPAPHHAPTTEQELVCLLITVREMLQDTEREANAHLIGRIDELIGRSTYGR